MDKKPKYKIKPEYMGCDVYTTPPMYERKDRNKFTLDGNLSQTDLGYLFEVIHLEAVEVAE